MRSAEAYVDLAEVLDDLGSHVGLARRARGLSMRQVGEAVGASQSTISRLEAGEEVSLYVAVGLLKWLGEESA